MLKNKIFLILSSVLILSLGSLNFAFSSGDPRTQAVITFNGLENKTFYVSLLDVIDYPPVLEAKDFNIVADISKERQITLAQTFCDYINSNLNLNGNFYRSRTVVECKGKLNWKYGLKKKFCVLIYLPDTEQFILSSPCELYAYVSYFKANISESNIKVQRNFNYGQLILTCFVQIALALLINIGFAFLFKFSSKKHLLTICITNLAVFILLSVLLYPKLILSGVTFELFLRLLAFGIPAFCIEAFIYCIVFYKIDEISRPKIFAAKVLLFTLLAYVVAFSLGALAFWWLGDKLLLV
jgi:hypothetical protein